MSRVVEFTSDGMDEARWYAEGLDDRDPSEDVLEWASDPVEGLSALLSYGGPTVVVTPDPFSSDGVIVHYHYGQDRGSVAVFAPRFAAEFRERTAVPG